MEKLIRIAVGLIVCHLAGPAFAQSSAASQTEQGSRLRLQLSPYTEHFTYDTEHRDVLMIGVEREHPDARIDGISLFTNSFGQPSVYLYPWGGVYHAIGGISRLSFRWTAGLLYGYVAPYQNKVPLNYKGFSPAVVPALAYEFMPGWLAQVDMLGTAGLMLQLSVALN